MKLLTVKELQAKIAAGGRGQGFGRPEGDACGGRGKARPAREADQAVRLERRGDDGEGLDHHQSRGRERPDVGAGLQIPPFDLYRQWPGHQPGRGRLGEYADWHSQGDLRVLEAPAPAARLSPPLRDHQLSRRHARRYRHYPELGLRSGRYTARSKCRLCASVPA